MSDPEIAQKSPYIVELEPGEYWWCACGRSTNQPFCSGAHKGTDFAPKRFVLDEKQTVAMCGCKRTKNPPFCDGSHSKL